LKSVCIPDGDHAPAQDAGVCWLACPCQWLPSWGTPLGSGGAQQGRSPLVLVCLQRGPPSQVGPSHCYCRCRCVLRPSWTLLSVLTGGPQAVAALLAAVVAPLACSNLCQLPLKVPAACWDHYLGAPANDRQAWIGINRLQLLSTSWTVPNSHDSPSSLTEGLPASEQQASSQEWSTWCAAGAKTVISKRKPLDDAQRRHAPCQAQGSSCACIHIHTHQTTRLIL
jgi:hypothetical protein